MRGPMRASAPRSAWSPRSASKSGRNADMARGSKRQADGRICVISHCVRQSLSRSCISDHSRSRSPGSLMQAPTRRWPRGKGYVHTTLSCNIQSYTLYRRSGLATRYDIACEGARTLRRNSVGGPSYRDMCRQPNQSADLCAQWPLVLRHLNPRGTCTLNSARENHTVGILLGGACGVL